MAAKKRMRKTADKKSRVWNRTLGHCHLCSEKLHDDDWQIDHLVPKAGGGVDDDWNLLPICGFCNRMKKAAERYKMRRVLMYGRYCLDKATERDTSTDGETIYNVVRQRVKALESRAKTKPPHVQLWKHTPKKQQ